MTMSSSGLESTEVKLALAAAAYSADRVRLVDPDLTGLTHLVATRQGLFGVAEDGWKLIAHGLFFGITLRGQEIFLFESCALPRNPSRLGRILRLTITDSQITDVSVFAKGLDNGCHQIDFLGRDLYVVDTYNQRLLRFPEGENEPRLVHPLPPASVHDGGSGYVHVNSILAVSDRRLLLLHNGAHTGRKSEIAVFDERWQFIERRALNGTGCHGLALLDDGTILTCGSMEGTVISPGGLRVQVSAQMTRGLAVGQNSLVVGASEKIEREGRLRNAGTVTFLDRDYRVRTVLELPGAPTEIRRLDGQDASLSTYLAEVPWGGKLR